MCSTYVRVPTHTRPWRTYTSARARGRGGRARGAKEGQEERGEGRGGGRLPPEDEREVGGRRERGGGDTSKVGSGKKMVF